MARLGRDGVEVIVDLVEHDDAGTLELGDAMLPVGAVDELQDHDVVVLPAVLVEWHAEAAGDLLQGPRLAGDAEPIGAQRKRRQGAAVPAHAAVAAADEQCPHAISSANGSPARSPNRSARRSRDAAPSRSRSVSGTPRQATWWCSATALGT